MQLGGFVGFEEVADFGEAEGFAVDDEFIFAGVFGDAEDGFYGVIVAAESLHEKVDVYHGASGEWEWVGRVMVVRERASGEGPG